MMSENKLELKLQGNLYTGTIDGKEFGFRFESH